MITLSSDPIRHALVCPPYLRSGHFDRVKHVLEEFDRLIGAIDNKIRRDGAGIAWFIALAHRMTITGLLTLNQSRRSPILL